MDGTTQDNFHENTGPQAGDIGLTEGEIETKAGEIVGDRVGDTPIDGVEQTHDGAGRWLPQFDPNKAPAVDNVPTPSPAIVAIRKQEGDVDHVAVRVAHVSWLQEELEKIEAVPRELLEYFERMFHKQAA